MPLNRAFLGRRCPPTPPCQVGRETIREFAAAIGELAPACCHPDAAAALGYPDLVAPPTFAIRLTLRADEQIVRDPELGLDYSHVVHREQHFIHHRAICAGDILSVLVTVVDIKSVAGNDILMTREEIVGVRQEPVCTATTTLVCRAIKR